MGLFYAAVTLLAGRHAAAAAPDKPWNSLSAEEASKAVQVEFTGTVLCYDPGWGQLYIHDGTNAVYLNPRSFTNHFEVGQRVKITGVTAWDGTAATLTNAAAVVMTKHLLPEASRVGLADLAKSPGQWIELSGQVRVAEASRERVTLILKEGSHECRVYVMQTSSADHFKQLADAEVVIQGINASQIQNGKLADAIVFAPGLAQVRIVTPGLIDRWDLPVTSIDFLLAKPMGEWTNQPVHLNGVVETHEPGASLDLKDPTGILRAEIVQVNRVVLDQRLDVWGFLETKSNRVVLADAYFEIHTAATGQERTTNAPARGAGSGPVLTDIRRVRSLPRAKAAEHLPVQVRGVLTFVDPEWRLAFLQDGHDAIFVDTAETNLAAGDWVEATGQTECTGFAPQLINCSVKILGTSNWPTAARVDMQDAANGYLDSQWVEMEGVVRRVSKDNGRIYLTLASMQGRFSAIIADSNPQTAPGELIDSRISIRGACGSDVNSRGQLSGITLHVPNRKEITVIDPSPADPFAIGATPVADVGTFNGGDSAGRRVKVSGIVTFVSADRIFYLQDTTGGIRIQAPPTEQVAVGDRVDLLGFPALLEFSPSLEEVLIRHVGTGQVPNARATTATQILQSGKDDGIVVELNAEVLQTVARSARPKLVLADGPIIFTAQFAQSGWEEAAPHLDAGSHVRVRGVCSIQAGKNNEPTGFQLLLGDARSITVTQAAPWWKPRYTLLLVCGTTLAALVAAAFVLSLRRQVGIQTEIIRRNHAELVQSSRLAGMAEIATSVLHNVGNVLNSVNVSTTIVVDKIKASGTGKLAKVVELMEEHRADLGGFITNHPRGKHLPGFLRQLAVALDQERETLLRELGELRKNVEHINEIVSMQQSFARVGGVLDTVDPGEMIEDALRIHASSLAHNGIEVQRHYDPAVGKITVDRHKLMQVLVNLISNAKHACKESGQSQRHIRLGVARQNGSVLLSVEDDGVGIPPENLVRIFSYGFTTRKNGHGFGLHSGALSAREMGGELTAQSDGPGHGAKFVLELPVMHGTLAKPSR